MLSITVVTYNHSFIFEDTIMKKSNHRIFNCYVRSNWLQHVQRLWPRRIKRW
ncbi:hypothetical protein JCM18901_455 [Psychrobacter sp. JCM 18901]|nr:hypothetical protein JCM18901_455 [Psychrobacter sp. JCM 18901]